MPSSVPAISPGNQPFQVTRLLLFLREKSSQHSAGTLDSPWKRRWPSGVTWKTVRSSWMTRGLLWNSQMLFRYRLQLPINCPLRGETIVSRDWWPLKRSAKRATALEACKKLHELGELDPIHLLPVRTCLPPEPGSSIDISKPFP